MIRKTALLVTGTVAGVVGVVSYNPPQLDAAIKPTQTTPPTASAATSTSAPATKAPATKAPASQKAKKSTSSQSSSAAAATQSTKKKATAAPTPAPVESAPQSSGISGTFAGNTSQTRWGPVQVQITVSNGKITDVKTLQYPNGDRRSLSISNQVIPWLQEETLQIQSANIQGISGATYTSRGFQSSLASAIQKAGI